MIGTSDGVVLDVTGLLRSPQDSTHHANRAMSTPFRMQSCQCLSDHVSGLTFPRTPHPRPSTGPMHHYVQYVSVHIITIISLAHKGVIFQRFKSQRENLIKLCPFRFFIKIYSRNAGNFHIWNFCYSQTVSRLLLGLQTSLIHSFYSRLNFFIDVIWYIYLKFLRL